MADGSIIVLLAGLATLVAAAVMTGVVRRMALNSGLLDVPNQRSSHTVATPRGGGLAIVVAAALALVGLAVTGSLPARIVVALLGGGGLVALIGFVDDRRGVSASVRLALHFAAAVWALVWLGGLPPIRIGGAIYELAWGGYVLGAFGIVWSLNLFNFMDGIDGIAASEAVFITVSGAVLAVLQGAPGPGTTAAIVFGAACLGFLLWNWPPARIFMGDVGSGFIGFFIAVLALIEAQENPVGLLAWLVLGGVFFVDATVTFIRRLARGERFYEAHRSHAYQWLARGWGSHRRVTASVALVNVIWLLPWAWCVFAWPEKSGWIVLVALAPLVVLALWSGAGRAESAKEGA